MPNWKKIITSGSDATLNSLFVTTAVTASRFSGSFTGSLLGTASTASYWSGSTLNAVSASYASTASYVVTALTASYFSGTVTSASYAGTASNINGGAANYIPLWNSATTLSSSIMYQSAGNVGISIISPTSKLHISGGNVDGIRVESSNAGYLEVGKTSGSRWRWSNDYNANKLLELLVNDLTGSTPTTSVIAISGSGNVGIGTITPSYKLDILGNPRIQAASGSNSNASLDITSGNSNYNSFIDFGYWGNGFDGTLWLVGRYGTDSGNFKIQDAGSGTSLDRMIITSNASAPVISFPTGSVGIGTTSPAVKLVVSGAVYLNQTADYFGSPTTIQMDSAGSGNSIGFRTNTFYLYPYSSNSAASLWYGYNGFQSWRLSNVGGHARFGIINSGSSELVSIAYSGNVGINNTSPSYQLDVSGSARINTGALGVNVAPNATNGRIDASNDIVAYSSDKRLKTNIQSIENPLNKIEKLSGFTYNWNNKAKELANYNTEESLVGVFAQDVQEVLPEAVKLAPFDNDGNDKSISGENYLTVQYEKIVPLLIEAIKEQQKQINNLQQQIDYIVNNK